jgi:hypothetical protein
MPCPDGLSSHSKETFILQQFPGVCSSRGDDFCLGDLFYYYELNVRSLKRSKLCITSSSHLGLMVMSLAFHPDDPGSIPGWNFILQLSISFL